MAIQIESAGPCVAMDGASWDYYSQTLQEIGPSRNVRITYDDGRMEIVTTSRLHERIKSIVGRLIEAYALEADVPVTADGSLTLRSQARRKGLEPDECYYVQTAPPPALEGEFDLSLYPPPDLAIEMEISHGSIPRLPIYAALGIAEVWSFDGQGIVVLHRSGDGQYARAERSIAFPALPIDQFNQWIEIAIKTSQHEALKALRQWVVSQK